MTSLVDATRDLRHRRFWLVLWVIAVILAVAACLLPSYDIPNLGGGRDKIAHITGFALMSIYAVMLFESVKARLGAAVFLSFLGILIEILQSTLTTTRSGDVKDWFADMCGILIGWIIGHALFRQLLQRIDRLLFGSGTR